MEQKVVYNNKINLYEILGFILIILLAFISIKKGGFYKSDNLNFHLFVEILAVIYFIIRLKHIKREKFDGIGFLLLLLSASYCLPIIFKNYTSLAESIFEMIRYFNLYIIYKIVKTSNYKKMYLNGFIAISVMLCIIGIDGLGARYLANILKDFGSGYLSIDLTRMSSTIQYANVLAVFLAISSMFVLDKMKYSYDEHKGKYLLNNTLFFILVSSIILTMSRMVIIIEIVSIIMYMFLNKKIKCNELLNILLQAIQVIIYTIVVQKLLYIDPKQIYIVTLIFIIANILISLSILKILNYFYRKHKEAIISRLNISSKYKYIIFGTVIVVTLVYIFIGLNISSPIRVAENSKEDIQRTIYDIEKEKDNLIKVKITEQEMDSRYRIHLFEIKNSNQINLLKTFEYYSKTSSEFEFLFKPDKDTKAICIDIDCYKGSITLDKVSINGRNKIIQYLILPSELVLKAKDVIYGSSSLNDRVNFLKDAFKIWNISNLNRVVGVGGEGFKNLYETVQSEPYSSTEVHNSYIQVLVESGIIGFILLILVIVIAMKISKNNIVKMAFCILLLHSIIDLNFSYMFMISVFGILLGILEEKELDNKNNERNNNLTKTLLVSEILIFATMLTTTMFILVRANIAYYMKIPVYTEGNLTLENQIELVNRVEKRVMLDSSEYVYRKELNEGYEKYLDMLFAKVENSVSLEKKDILVKEIKNIIYNIKTNADIIKKDDKYSKTAIFEVTNIYIKNIRYFVELEYSEDMEEGYKTYLVYIMNNLEYIQDGYKHNENTQTKLKNTYTMMYNELTDKNKILNSEVISEYIEVLETKI